MTERKDNGNGNVVVGFCYIVWFWFFLGSLVLLYVWREVCTCVVSGCGFAG